MSIFEAAKKYTMTIQNVIRSMADLVLCKRDDYQNKAHANCCETGVDLYLFLTFMYILSYIEKGLETHKRALLAR